MKILFARRGFSPSGGAEKYLSRLAAALVKAGHEVSLATSIRWPSESWNHGALHLIDGTTPWQFSEALGQLKNNLELNCVFSLERVVGADIYRVGDGLHKVWLSRLKRHSHWASSFLRESSSKHRELLKLERSIFTDHSKTKFIANSRMVADEIVTHYKVSQERITVIPNGYDKPLTDSSQWAKTRSKARLDLGVGSHECLLLFVGSGWKRKGAYRVIQSMKRLSGRRIKLVLAGKGRPNVMSSPNVSYLGQVQDVSRLYAAADIFILPTLYDPFSNACVEASCHGLPVITSAYNGFSDHIVPGLTGSILNDPTSVEDIAMAIIYWEDSVKRKHARSELAARTEQWSVRRNMESTLKVITSTFA